LLSDCSSPAIFGINSDAFLERNIIKIQNFQKGLVGSRVKSDGVIEAWV
jgi:hypothetical protein